MSIAIAIEIGSPSSQLGRVETTISSIMTNIGTPEYRLVIAMAPYIDKQIKDYVYSLKRDYGDVIDLMPEEDYYWADFINEAIDRSRGCKYFIKSHDDIELLTPNFLPKIERILGNIREPLGWISFTDKDYLNGHFAPPTRPGYHVDHLYEKGWERRKLFQFHTLPENWWRPSLPLYRLWLMENMLRSRLHMKIRPLPLRPKEYYANLRYDFPTGPVKCHAPFNHFVLIEMDRLLRIGKCERWSSISLLVDEDWGLRALQSGLYNVWIPDIDYVHFRPGGGNRGWNQIVKVQEHVHKLFFEKWGFHSEGRIEELDFIKEKYKNTNIPWSIDRRSYEWDYIR